MKTWEMIKALTENPKLKFKSKSHIANLDDRGLLYLHFHLADIVSSGPSGNLRLASTECNEVDEWELVREPVTWQEAIRAWLEDRKGFYIEWDGNTYMQLRHRRLGCLKSGQIDIDGFESGMFVNGKWYIEE